MNFNCLNLNDFVLPIVTIKLQFQMFTLLKYNLFKVFYSNMNLIIFAGKVV